MPATPLDSALYRDLLGDRDVGALFTDSAEVRAMLLVEGALAKVQGAAGVIPQISGEAIHRASLEVQVDAASLAPATGDNAVPVPALVLAFRDAMQAPDHAQYVHWGATSQDIMDTGLMLRLRQTLVILEARLLATIRNLGALAETHAELPIAGRTYGQNATPTSFGAIAASWGRPLIGQHAKLQIVRGDLLHVSLSGAAGTLSAMGESGPAIRAQLAKALGLADPGASWHSTRDTVAGLAAWLTALTGSLGKMGEDITLMTQSGIGETTLGQTGSSSTMPQKSNPVQPSLLVAIARQMVGLNAVMQSAIVHRQQRDAAAWITEWLSLPQMCLLAARALSVAETLTKTIEPRGEAMVKNLKDGLGLVHAEALTFALAANRPRPEAQNAVKALCDEARENGTELALLAERDYPNEAREVFDSSKSLGQAPSEARAFADAAKALWMRTPQSKT